MKRIAIIVLCLAAGTAAAWMLARGGGGSAGESYRTSELERGDIESTVSSTGTISAVGTVEVGAQVSGTIASLHADFNDRVAAGDLLAVLDTTMLHAALLEARANHDRQTAQLEQSRENWNRNRALHEQDLIGDAELLPFRTQYRSDEADLQSADAQLERAASNLDYAVIRSPIEGTVINRVVEEGQTVAASMSTPLLFKIAEDLSRMEILAQVDESDIGSVEVGQNARFTVLAHPDLEFPAVVSQIRLEPSTVQNVVTYTVVLQVDNQDRLLMPGMTATVNFLVEERRDVLMVPSSALRLRPNADMLAAMRAARDRRGGARPDSAADGQSWSGAGTGGFGDGFSGGETQADMALLWVIDEAGGMRPCPVRTGATDGSNTEIVAGRGLSEGLRVITAVLDVGDGASESSDPRGGRGFGGPGRPPF